MQNLHANRLNLLAEAIFVGRKSIKKLKFFPNSFCRSEKGTVIIQRAALTIQFYLNLLEWADEEGIMRRFNRTNADLKGPLERHKRKL